MRIILMIIGAAVVAYLLANGIRALLIERKQRNQPHARKENPSKNYITGSARDSAPKNSGGSRT